jgi:hypothetical protein
MTVEPAQPVEEAIVDILQREGNQDQGINGEFGDQEKADFRGVVVRQVTSRSRRVSGRLIPSALGV